MSWPQSEAIADGVEDMLRVNMGLKPGERLLVVTDVPRTGDWQSESQAVLESMLERAVLARLVADVAARRFPECSVAFLPFPAVGQHGAELDPATAACMREADVLLGLTTYSLSHTNARQGATGAGVRVASMPGFEAQMLEPGGPMAADYRQIAADCRILADLLTAAEEVVIRSPHGTHLSFSLLGRPGQVDDGLYGTAPGLWGNLPAGETYAIPVEASGEGQLVVPAGWYPDLREEVTFRFEGGQVVEIRGGGAVGDRFRQLLDPDSHDPILQARRNLAELGVGTNPNARRPDNVLEAEKIKGTVHLGVGDNIHMGGQVESDSHEDLLQPQPDLILDGRPVIVKGEWRI
jgi:leucyl aminopeptidase (aminopeptidase T)